MGSALFPAIRRGDSRISRKSKCVNYVWREILESPLHVPKAQFFIHRMCVSFFILHIILDHNVPKAQFTSAGQFTMQSIHLTAKPYHDTQVSIHDAKHQFTAKPIHDKKRHSVECLFIYSLARIIFMGFILPNAMIGTNADMTVIATTTTRSIIRAVGWNVMILKSFSAEFCSIAIKLSLNMSFATSTAIKRPIEDIKQMNNPATSIC